MTKRSKVSASHLVAVLGSPLLVLGMWGCAPAEQPPAAGAQENREQHTREAQIARGRYLVRVGSCNDCHTPWVFDEELGVPRPDMTRMLSGHPEGGPDPEGTVGAHDQGLIGPTFTSFALPFGIVYSTNLTPDGETGTGTWTEQMFLDIFRKGRHLGGDGRGVLPPMPWVWIRNLNDEDLKAIFAYLQSIPPIRNSVPSPKVEEEVLWQLRDRLDRFAAQLPQEGWAAAKP